MATVVAVEAGREGERDVFMGLVEYDGRPGASRKRQRCPMDPD
jgi:hypothetical protein